MLKLKSFFIEQLPATFVVISYPITGTDSKHLAVKIADIQSHRKLQIEMTENGNISSNHLNNRRLHWNRKCVLQFAKKLIGGIWKLQYETELLRQKEVVNFTHNDFYQPIVYSIDYFNSDLKKQRESFTNQKIQIIIDSLRD